MMRTANTVTAILLSLCLCAAAQAGDAEAGKAKSGVCVACHGPDGNSTNPIWPHLAGQQEQYLVKATKDYKSGVRNDPMMAPIVAPLSDADIADLAAYYASQKQK